MRRKRYLSKEIIEQIRSDARNKKTKYQIAKELDINRNAVYYWTKDIPSKQCGWPGIRGKTLNVLQELLTKGFAFSPCAHHQDRYKTLRKYFPMIRKIKIYSQQILYLEGKEDVAVRAFLEHVNKKIINYQELKQVTKVFGVDLSKQEKEAFLLRKRGKRWVKNKGVPNQGSLREKGDSFSFFYLRGYCCEEAFLCGSITPWGFAVFPC